MPQLRIPPWSHGYGSSAGWLGCLVRGRPAPSRKWDWPLWEASLLLQGHAPSRGLGRQRCPPWAGPAISLGPPAPRRGLRGPPRRFRGALSFSPNCLELCIPCKSPRGSGITPPSAPERRSPAPSCCMEYLIKIPQCEQSAKTTLRRPPPPPIQEGSWHFLGQESTGGKVREATFRLLHHIFCSSGLRETSFLRLSQAPNFCCHFWGTGLGGADDAGPTGLLLAPNSPTLDRQ